MPRKKNNQQDNDKKLKHKTTDDDNVQMSKNEKKTDIDESKSGNIIIEKQLISNDTEKKTSIVTSSKCRKYECVMNNISKEGNGSNICRGNIQKTIKNECSIIKGDCLECLDLVQDKSVQLICIDPPYNIGKDTWDKIDNYNEFIMNVIKKLENKLKDNGSFFMFHNDMEVISELMVRIKKETKFVFKQMIVWNKRFENSPRKGFLDGFVVKTHMHNFNKMAEYILFYTFDNSYKLKTARKELKVNQITISQEIKSKTGGLTGWYSNLETGKNMPTRETMKPIEKHLKLQFEDIVPKFNNMKTHHSVWNYDMAKRCKVHVTPKPIELLKNIILHTTDENDIVLDCFAGSGSLAYACLETKRQSILIEKDTKYTEYIVKQVEDMGFEFV